MPPFMSSHSVFEWVAAFILAVVASARLTRLVVWDKYPPTAWLRIKWDTITDDGEWSVLAHCGYCFGLWAALFVVGWGWLSDLHWSWWLFCGWLTVGYFAAMTMAYDGDDEE